MGKAATGETTLGNRDHARERTGHRILGEFQLGTEILQKRVPCCQVAETAPVRWGGFKSVGDLETVVLIARAEMTCDNFGISAGNHRSLFPEA